MSRHDRSKGERPAARLVDTGFALAKQVAAILAAAGYGTEHLVDAHVVAACVPHVSGLVVTSDPGDVLALAGTVPAARIPVTSPG